MDEPVGMGLERGQHRLRDRACEFVEEPGALLGPALGELRFLGPQVCAVGVLGHDGHAAAFSMARATSAGLSRV
jgi:hypothetical protein